MAVSGDIINQHGVLPRSRANYRALEALNFSMIKLFDSDPVKFYEQFKLGKKRKDSKTTSLIIGDLVDFFLLDCKGNEDEFNNRFDEKFALFEGTKGSGQVFVLVDALFEITQNSIDENGEVSSDFFGRFKEAVSKVQAEGKYKGKPLEKILEDFTTNGQQYFDSLMANIGKIVIDVSLLEKAKSVYSMIQNDPFTEEIFKESEHLESFPKHIIEWVYTCKDGKEIKCKSEIDLLQIDHETRTIYPKDLKTTYDNEVFEFNYLKHAYYLQAAFYGLAVGHWILENNLLDYHIEPMEFIVGDTSANNRRPIRYQLQQFDIDQALLGFAVRGIEYRGLRDIIEEISWAENTDNWNVSKKSFDNHGIIKLHMNYDS